MMDERLDYQQQQQEEQRRDEEERERLKKYRDSWRVWAETGAMPEQSTKEKEHAENR